MIAPRHLRVAELIQADADAVRREVLRLPRAIVPVVSVLPVGVLLTLEVRRHWWDRRPRSLVLRGLERRLAMIITATARVWVVGAVLRSGERVLAAQRNHPESMAGRWEFPGGKVELGESLQRALVRECNEELGVYIEVGAELGRADLATGAELILFWAELAEGSARPEAREHRELRWCSSAGLAELDWLATNRQFATEVADQIT